MKGKITKKSVDGLDAGPGGEATMWDSDLRGFGVRARAGGAKTYVLRYRANGGGRGAPLRTFTIGKHGSPWTPDQARDEAGKILAAVKLGQDPAAARSDARKAPTVSDLAERFLAEHAEAKRKSRTAEEYRRLIAKHVEKPLGKLKAADVTRANVVKLHNGMKATPYQANRVLAVLRKMFNLAEAWGVRPAISNPCHKVEPFKERGRERMLSGAELAALGAALTAYEGNTYAKAAVRLLIFTGARLSEILTLQWAWIDLERGEARLPDSKTGAKTIHLSAPARTILAELPRVEGNPHVIVGDKSGAPLVNLQKPWRAIRKLAAAELLRTAEDLGPEELDRARPVAAALAETRIHDLRHAFASVGAASGLGLPIIGRMLGHTQPATTARYAHLQSDPVKAAAAAVAARIADAMNPPAHSADVTDLASKRHPGAAQ